MLPSGPGAIPSSEPLMMVLIGNSSIKPVPSSAPAPSANVMQPHSANQTIANAPTNPTEDLCLDTPTPLCPIQSRARPIPLCALSQQSLEIALTLATASLLGPVVCGQRTGNVAAPLEQYSEVDRGLGAPAFIRSLIGPLRAYRVSASAKYLPKVERASATAA